MLGADADWHGIWIALSASHILLLTDVTSVPCKVTSFACTRGNMGAQTKTLLAREVRHRRQLDSKRSVCMLNQCLSGS